MIEPFWLTLRKAGFIQDAIRVKAMMLVRELREKSLEAGVEVTPCLKAEVNV